MSTLKDSVHYTLSMVGIYLSCAKMEAHHRTQLADMAFAHGETSPRAKAIRRAHREMKKEMRRDAYQAFWHALKAGVMLRSGGVIR